MESLYNVSTDGCVCFWCFARLSLDMPDTKSKRNRLGRCSALEWVLDQYKEKKPRDPTIAERFNTYRFADHKEKVIDILRRVCTVSVRTTEIVDGMANWNDEGRPVASGHRDRRE